MRNGKISCSRGKKTEHTVEELCEHDNPLLNEKAVLAAWLRDADGSVMLFTSRLGSGMTHQQVYNLFSGAAFRAGIERGRRNPHILKHSHASHLLRNGADLAYVQKALGHKHIGSTTRYTPVSVQEAQAVSDKILGALFA